MSTRGIAILATFGFCFCAWTLVYLGGLYAAARFLRWFAVAEAGEVVGTALLLGGFAMILLGGWLRYVGRSIDEPLSFPLSRAGRFAVAIGALVTFGGAGAVLAVGVG